MVRKRQIYLFSLLPLVLLAIPLLAPEPQPESFPQPAPVPLKMTLSGYGFFEGELKNLKPTERVIPYTLNTPLFSDYAFKARFAYIPEGETVTYHDSLSLDFPKGTVLIKNFYYPDDFNQPEGDRRIMETRLLVNNGTSWKALPYVWDESQTDATLDVAGGRSEVSWTHYDGKERKIEYSVPNANQCKGCHKYAGATQPIGPTGRQLNRNLDYGSGPENQLQYWAARGLLTGLPETPAYAPVWDDPATGSLDERARIYLDINCAHCHKPDGTANTSGLFLDYHEQDLTALGLNKPPTAAGRGSGGRQYGIVPGHPEQSILLYRMETEDPGEMMPEIGRKMIHEEGVALIRKWIQQMDQ